MKPKMLELLSPAKNLEYGITAIDFGADAVYIGAPKFSARINASNSLSDIERLCSYAHRFHSKVFVALNTIIFDNELEEVEKLIHKIHEAGADALIIQDMGILEMNLPPIELHASTQCHNFDLNKIKFLENVGFSRVILSREMSLDYIKQIRSSTNIELEVFVHGALCVGFSGQCYMSAFNGSRSGNRGECAQPCRLSYDLLDENKNVIIKNKQILSLRDLNLNAHIAELANAGVSSFKIEGRLKDLNYVKNITALYRKKLDEIIENNNSYKKSSLGQCSFNFEPDASKSFNRGFTTYFFHERSEKISANTSKSIGKKLGKIIEVGENYFKIDTNEIISNGDGLCWFAENGELMGCNVNAVQQNKVFVDKKLSLKKGISVYRNLDVDFIKKLAQAKKARKIPVNIHVSEFSEGIKLSVFTSDNEFVINKEFETEKILANDAEKAMKNIITQLSKSGNTDFVVEKCEVNFEKPLFFSMSELNEFRRTTLNSLEELIFASYERKKVDFVPNDFPYFEKNLNYMGNVANGLAAKFYKRHGVEKIEKTLEINNEIANKVLMTTKFCLRFENDSCLRQNNENAIKPCYISLNDKTFKLEFDCNKCVMKIIEDK